MNVEPIAPLAERALQSSNERDLPLAFTPELNIRFRVTPAAAKGITRRLIPDRPGPPVRTAAVQ